MNVVNAPNSRSELARESHGQKKRGGLFLCRIREQARSYRVALPLLVVGLLAACEAPLHLEKVEAEQANPARRFDHFKAVASQDDKVVAVADAGVVLTSTDGGRNFTRRELPTRSAFMAVDDCPAGHFVALDTRRTVWKSDTTLAKWTPLTVETQETPMSLGCDLENRIWVTAGFSTFVTSEDDGKTWVSSTQDEDMMITAIQFHEGFTVAAAEFGTLMISEDGGQYWGRAEPMPGEFYPMGLHFADRQRGWVSGLSGTILHTPDGGRSWVRQETGTSKPLYAFTAIGKGDAQRIFAMGDNGTLLELNGERWDAVPAADAVHPYIVSAVPVADNELLVTGGAGTLTALNVQERMNALGAGTAIAAAPASEEIRHD